LAQRLYNARDLTPGDHDVPPFNLGGQDMYAFSPDSQEVAYTSNIDEVEATARTTKFSSCRLAEGLRRKFPPVPALTRRRFIHRMENISHGARKRAPALKPINGGSSCKIDNREDK
jgi:hypothetical protein